MQRFFIADIHLNENEPEITAGFLHFLASLPANCELYILGDLFDYWIGDDIATPLHLMIARHLSALTRRNIKSFFIHGNRDFLLNHHFCQLCHMQLLPEVSVLDDHQDKMVILHGDLLCTDDKSYQRFRRKMHNKGLQRLFLLLPRYLRNKIADKLRNKSYQHNQQKAEYIMDVNQQAVELLMAKQQANVMIHGHIHKLATHDVKLAGTIGQRMVLGAWHDGVNYIHQDDQGHLNVICANQIS
ncbi:UDP-2,3-diacylglucosamine hydrolase [Orbus hercynius]|uniref:UDP-2,3-diacylglucosamine hydrolase n=1 Tax=Orbus hercynius TaxID=593135 RepID=A0A495RJT6_9GAMM|nr:UDP-2,3-diacylglucosamine diphosphatase [Orbus hercynius]RKS87803.1 UDP-2,3-diacylglucosamine hydrolase [Orbus hercynius]